MIHLCQQDYYGPMYYGQGLIFLYGTYIGPSGYH